MEYPMLEADAEVETRRRVRIHIDQEPHESPNPTTGEALYVLGRVPPGLELYREVAGDEAWEPLSIRAPRGAKA